MLTHTVLALLLGVAAPDFARLEAEVVDEFNRFRASPAQYAALIEATLPQYQGVLRVMPDGVRIMTAEGPSAVVEAARELRKLGPLPLSTRSPELDAAARDHARDQARTGATGHDGSDGSTAGARISRYGEWSVTLGENIAYGRHTGREVLMALLVDDGVRGRGHRTILAVTLLRRLGVGCDAHPTYGTVCVLDHAGEIKPRPGSLPPPPPPAAATFVLDAKPAPAAQPVQPPAPPAPKLSITVPPPPMPPKPAAASAPGPSPVAETPKAPREAAPPADEPVPSMVVSWRFRLDKGKRLASINGHPREYDAASFRALLAKSATLAADTGAEAVLMYLEGG
jgi:uncharacterized protein YkwD